MEEYRAGFWEKESSKGNIYYYGKLKIADKEYQCILFKNNKTNEKQPDFNLIIRNNINIQETQKLAEKQHKNSDLEQVKQVIEEKENVFEEFGNEIDISDKEIAF